MAKRIEAGKFLVVECTARELTEAVGSEMAICDWCARPCLPSERGYYIAVLNQWFCKDCFEGWLQRATWYPEDADIERKNFDFYAPRFGLRCQ